MTAPVTPEQIELLVAGYVLGDLSPEEADELEQLLQEDPDLWVAVSEAQIALEQSFGIEEQAPPTYLKQSILSAAEVLQQAAVASDRTPESRPAVLPSIPASPAPSNVIPLSRWRRGLGAAAAVVIAGLGISNIILWQSLQSLQVSRRTTDQNPLVFTLERTPLAPSPDASVQVVVDPKDLEATLDIKNLPPLADGEVYVLWTVVKPNAPVTTDDKDAILTQVFRVDAQGQFSQRIAVPPVFRDRGLVQAVAVTIENAKAPQKHLAKPILIQRI
ncbi:anti-sigma factor [Synechococcus elongatus]|uniref:anti-sigma factor n=1 Tax=Synechococcus elongatus TaxID=32046 RepID=UPI000F7EA300|nr:anti-sigma factor [Synechococcus elongatus]